MPGAGRPSWRSALRSSLAGVALAGFGTVPGMGLPGGAVMEVAAPLIALIWGLDGPEMFPRDSAWPFAILLTWTLAPLVPAAWLGTRALGVAGWRRALAVTAGLLLGGVALAVTLHALLLAPPPRPT